MSWLNFNESLNSLKGQLTNFASGVLTEGIVNPENSSFEEELPEDVQDKFTNIELQRSSNVLQREVPDGWSWDSPGDSLISAPDSKDEIISNLQKKVASLENDKRELTVSLEQLDIDCQQTTDKLVTLKDQLQIDYDDLKIDFENMKKEYTIVLNENMNKSKEVQITKTGTGSELNKLQEENNALNKQLMISLKEIESKNELAEKFKELKIQCDGHLEALIEERLISEELQKLYSNLESANASLSLQLAKVIDPIENTNLLMHNNTLIAQNEEACKINDRLKTEIALLKNDYENRCHEIIELKSDLDDSQKLCKTQQQCNKELVNKLQAEEGNLQGLKEEIDRVKHECMLINEQKEKASSLQILTSTSKHYETDYQKCIDIISDYIKGISTTNETEDPTTSEFFHKVCNILNPLLICKEKYEQLQVEVSRITQEKSDTIADKNNEIEKLLKNSEILSQEVINKSQSLKDIEDECAELMKNNDLLITELDSYRKSCNLQTISESNEDNLLLLEVQLENSNKRVLELESSIQELENSKQDNLELELIKKHLGMTGQELSQAKEEFSELQLHYKQLEDDKLVLKSTLDKTKSDFENMEYKYTEVTINYESLKEEHEQLKNKHIDFVANFQKISVANASLENKISHLLESERKINEKLLVEVENNTEKEIKIKSLDEKLQNSKMVETGLKLQVDTLHKELQTVADAKQNLELKYNTLLSENENKSSQENEVIQSRIAMLEEQLKEITISRDDLITLVRSKHEENVKYHDEIQRLNLLLCTEVDKSATLEKQLNELSVDNISPEEITQKDLELEKVKDQNNFLREKCEVLAQSLLQEQSNSQKILQERQLAIDQECVSSKELERLRQHLVEIEEGYTQELLLAEQKNKEMLLKVNEIEQREKDSSSIYTSVNIRANQQVETLSSQLQLVTSQRDELRVTISDLEDKENKQVAALTNLQLVLEHFQRDKEKDVLQETERIRRQINYEKQIQEELKTEISSLKLQLEESKQGLQAASRLSDQLEKVKQQTCSYKDEIVKLQDQLHASENQYKELASSSDIKVDKTLIKNLVLGYITSHVNDQRQILKVIATVLDFNEQESEKAHLNKPVSAGWLNTILHPQMLESNPDTTHQSLSEAFVRFLENESKPKADLPNLLIATQQSKDNSNSGNGLRQSPHSLPEVVLPTFEDFGSSRSSSSILKGVLKNNS